MGRALLLTLLLVARLDAQPLHPRDFVVTLFSGACPDSRLFADEDWLYWTESRDTRPYWILWRMPRSGKKPQRLSSECTRLHLVDETAVYCDSYGNGRWWLVPRDGSPPHQSDERRPSGNDLHTTSLPLVRIDKASGKRLATLVDRPFAVEELVADGESLFFSSHEQVWGGLAYGDLFTLSRVPKRGGPVAALASDPGGLALLRLARAALVYDSGALFTIATSGGTPRKLAEITHQLDTGLLDLAGDDSAVYLLLGDYWMLGTTAKGAARLVRQPLDGGSSSVIATFAEGWPRRIAADATHVYVEFSSGLRRLSKSGGAVESYLATEKLKSSLISGSEIFVVQWRSPKLCAIKRMPR